MISFFKGTQGTVYAVGLNTPLSPADTEKLVWLFGNATPLSASILTEKFIGPRREMVTPWSTNAVEITQNMGVSGIFRMEEFEPASKITKFDPMLQREYDGLNQEIYTIDKQPEPIIYIDELAAYNQQEGLALSLEEISYLEGVSKELGRKLTDTEVFGFSQVNSEHCRHKIFNGRFIIDGVEKESSLFEMIKKTSNQHPNRIVSAYKDNVAFVQGPKAEQFAPATQDKADFFKVKDIETTISLKAETHNFPTTVEPFYGASTGTGGEIRDRMAGGTGSIPLAGTAVYMTSYSRLEAGRNWENGLPERKWLYQTPMDILIKASNGASDFGNKFGQPVICGSVLTFEHQENGKKYGYDKVIMQAGGIGYGKKEDAQKKHPAPGDKIIIMGGDNYRIGLGGSAVSSVATGQFSSSIELNAIQRANPEMQKRVCNAIRAMAEADENPIVSIHDHGAGGHLNCLSELVEETGGNIQLDKLPIGDPTLSSKEILCNESQERMGLVMREKDIDWMKRVSERERAPFYAVGEITGDHQFTFEDKKSGSNPVDLKVEHLFGKSPKTVMQDESLNTSYKAITYDINKLHVYVEQVLQLESVACKDWLTNKVDRSVTGKVAKQQTAGEIQLPLNNVAVMAIDYQGIKGIATSIGHAPVAALVNPQAGSRLAIAEALANLVWAPIQDGLKGVSLSANWMWPAKNKGEDARLYDAVQAISDFACSLGINVPTGKDSLSMTQKYQGSEPVYSPGTVIISTVGEASDINKVVSPVLKNVAGSEVLYIDLTQDTLKLGGSSFGQILNLLGTEVPDIKDAYYFKKAFEALQQLINQDLVLAGHDVSSGGLITALLEMCFANQKGGLKVNADGLNGKDIVEILFSENPALLIQIKDVAAISHLEKSGVQFVRLASLIAERSLQVNYQSNNHTFDIDALRDVWYKTSYLLDRQQSGASFAESRYKNYKKQALSYQFPEKFEGKYSQWNLNNKRRNPSGIKAAIIREKGVNGDREMAWALFLAGFDVKDVHMTDLISGRENLEDVHMIAFVGGFSNSDVLGSAKGWAGAFLYNEKAKKALDNFYARPDTLSLGVCNGCQLMVELGLIYPEHVDKPKMLHNASHKFESTFINVTIGANDSVMLGSLSGTRLGIWLAHGEGKFHLPYAESEYSIAAKYSYSEYPANPNGSDFDTACIYSKNGRHLGIMPHLERSLFPWNWAHYPENRQNDEVSPWIEAFVNAREWVEKKVGKKSIINI